MYRITVIIQTRRVGVYTVDNYSKNKNKKGRSIYSIHRSGGGGGPAVGRLLRSEKHWGQARGRLQSRCEYWAFRGGRGVLDHCLCKVVRR